MPETWQSISKRKKEEQLNRIPKEWRLPESAKPSPGTKNLLDIPRKCGILTENELDITERYDATSLSEAIRGRALSCVDVTTAFCKRAAIAHQLTNCLTEIFFANALERASSLDAHLASGKPPLSPLHGIPISLKDTFCIRGYDASIGIASLCFQPSTQNATLVDLLLSAGAVLYCKTNIPQTLMALDSHNNVFGRTLNPGNIDVTPGGSTGGEGALIAMRGSVLGIGTDVGGSIRIPAMCNGLYGVKPSWQRVPYQGQQSGQLPAAAKVSLPASAGPLATTLRDCELLLKVVAEMEPWNFDADVAFGGWFEQGQLPSMKHGKRLRVGIVKTDGLIEPLPPISRLMDDVKNKLRSRNIDAVELDIRSIFSKCQSTCNALMGVEGGNAMFDLLEKTAEPLSPWLAGRLKRKGPKTLEQLREIQAKREELAKQFLKVWKDENGELDAIICPVAPHPVPGNDKWNGVSYTSSFVLLDYPAGTLPARSVRADDLHGDVSTSEPLSSWDKANRALWTDVDRNVYIGTCLSIQIVAPKLQERRLLQAMKAIDAAMKIESPKARL